MKKTFIRLSNCEVCNSSLSFPNKFTCSEKCRKIRKSEYDRIRNKKLSKENVERVRRYRKGRGAERWQKDRLDIKTNPMRYYYKTILTLLSRYLRKELTPKYSKTMKIFPFELEALREKLKNNVPKGYTWQDYIDGNLHLDHEKPHSLFNYSHHSDEDFKECWSLSNLRLLPKEINITRQNNYEQH